MQNMKKLMFLATLFVVAACGEIDKEIKKPEEFIFGKSVREIEALIKPLCEEYRIRQIVPPTAPLVEETQSQIDCTGFKYAGKARTVELVFQDDQLDIVWILFPKEEKSKILKEFKSEYGEPTMEIDFGTIFLSQNAAIRNTPPEVLFASSRQVKAMLEELQRE